MFFISDAFAQTAAGGDTAGLITSLLPMILIFVAFWFFLIRPQQKRQKEHAKMVDALTKGDEVLTAGGIAGRVVEVRDDYMVVQIATVKEEPVTLTMQRVAVQTVLPKGKISSSWGFHRTATESLNCGRFRSRESEPSLSFSFSVYSGE